MKKILKTIVCIALLLAFSTTFLGFSTIAVKSIKVNSSNVTIKVGKTYSLKVSYTPVNTTQKLVNFSTANRSIASVDKNGLIKGIRPGKTIIKVISSSNKAVIAQCNLTVLKDPGSIVKPVKLTWYLGGTEQPQEALVEAEANKVLKEKINATLDMIVIPFGSFTQKMQVKMASDEQFDLCFSSFSWVNLYLQNVARGAFVPMDDLLKNYAPKFYKALPEKYWDATRVGGKIYGAPNYQIMLNYKGVLAKKSLADKYNLKTKDTTLEDLEAFMENIKKNEQGVIPVGIYKVPGHNFLMDYGKNPNDYWDSPGAGGSLKFSDKTYTLQNSFTSSEAKKRFDDFVGLMRKWYLKGYIAKDAASKASTEEDIVAGRLGIWPSTIKPGYEAEFKAKYGYDIVQIPLIKPYITTLSALATLTAISRTSNNPERAAMFLELVNTDKYLYNLLVFGLENKHYKKIKEDNVEKVEKIDNGGYWSGIAWALGNQFNAYLTKGQSPNVWEDTIKLNEAAIPSPIIGFTANLEPIKALVANTRAVDDEFMPGLITGTVDPDKYLPQYYEKLKQADPEFKALKEMQKQLDEWLIKQGKK